MKVGLGESRTGVNFMLLDSAPSPDCFRVEAPAKINLWLRVLRRRADGFHEVETRLAPLALSDRLSLQVDPGLAGGEIVLSCDDATVPGDESNLVVRAIRALEGATGRLPGLRFHLEKRVPHGAGLGGGSSDAAAALRLVEAALGLALEPGALAAAAAEVGSDVPFFLLGQVADASGRGERVVAVPSGAAARLLLVKLPFGVATPWAYRQWGAALEVEGLPYGAQASPWGELRNDLERPVFEKYQVLGHVKAALLGAAGVSAALMSGSGSTVMAFLEDGADAAAARAAVQAEVGAEVWMRETHLAPGLRAIERVAAQASLRLDGFGG